MGLFIALRLWVSRYVHETWIVSDFLPYVSARLLSCPDLAYIALGLSNQRQFNLFLTTGVFFIVFLLKNLN